MCFEMVKTNCTIMKLIQFQHQGLSPRHLPDNNSESINNEKSSMNI